MALTKYISNISHDNDPKYKVKCVKEWLMGNKINIVTFLPFENAFI